MVDGESVSVSDEEVIITETPRSGWAVASDSGETIALDLNVTPELRRAGLAREMVRLIQDARKSSGFEVSDRISCWWTATDEDLAESLTEHGQMIASEVLATSFESGSVPTSLDTDTTVTDDEFGLVITVRRKT